MRRAEAQRFVLQIVVAMFAEDIGLLPQSIISTLTSDCLHKGQSSFDLFGGLFQQMNSKQFAKGGRFRDVQYFNGGIFKTIKPVELTPDEINLIGGSEGAATEDWSKVSPAIFGSIFQQSMNSDERHTRGAHFTSEADIMKIITPTILTPWRERIDKSSSMKEILELRSRLLKFKVLDPACGSGNFLYLSYRELVRVELELIAKLKDSVSENNFKKHSRSLTLISPKQFYGIDTDSFAVELAKVTLMLAKKLAIDESREVFKKNQTEMPLWLSEALPLDNLDQNFSCQDALFSDWPAVDTIVGNPPFQSKNKMISEFGRAYVNRVRDKFPRVSGRADYCVYWFRKSHDHLEEGQNAGLVGTNTIRQNYSRMGGLDYIINNGGTITEAVSTQVWSGDAAVQVSLVSWKKGEKKGKKTLLQQLGHTRDSPWKKIHVDHIGASLSFEVDVGSAAAIRTNAITPACFQGQTHGHKGFLIERWEAERILNGSPDLKQFLHPFLIATELSGTLSGLPKRYVIDFENLDIVAAKKNKELFSRVQLSVLPAREKAATLETNQNRKALLSNPNAKTAKDHNTALEKWWTLFRRRDHMLRSIKSIPRYIVCGRVAKYPIFEFISSEIRPNDSLVVFPYSDDYTYGVLQSSIHWDWCKARCSTLGNAPRYTSNTVFDSFPWPQSPSMKQVRTASKASRRLRKLRNKLRSENGVSLRELYRLMELPGVSPLKDAHAELDLAVRDAYGISESDDTLSFILDMNKQVVENERSGKVVMPPGLPEFVTDSTEFVSSDCIAMPHKYGQ